MGRWQQLSPFYIRLDFVMGTRDLFDDDNKFHCLHYLLISIYNI